MFFRDLKNLISQKTDFDIQRIQHAYEMAFEVHKNILRKSGEPFIIHPLAVAKTILEIGGDEDMICAALLHDVIEDCEYDQKQYWRDQIFNQFGPDVYFLVEAVSKDERIEDKNIKQKEYCERIEEGISQDASIFFLKMADLINNMETIDALKPEKRAKWIHELKTLYMPMIVRNFHKVPFHYRDMYQNLTDTIERTIESHETDSLS